MLGQDGLVDLADCLTDPPSGGKYQKWYVGLGLAMLVGAYGLWCCVTQRATIPSIRLKSSVGGGHWYEMTGTSAVSFGCIFLCVGAFMHFQWFWGNDERLQDFYEIGKYSAVVGAILATTWHIVIWFF